MIDAETTAIVDNIALQIIDVMRSQLPEGMFIPEGKPMPRLVLEKFRPLVTNLVAETLVNSPEEDAGAIISPVVDAVLRLIGEDMHVLSRGSQVHVFATGISTEAVVGEVSVTFKAGGTLSANVAVKFDPRRPAQSGWLDTSNFRGAMLIAYASGVASVVTVAGPVALYEVLTQEAVATELVIIGDGVRVRLSPSEEAEVLGSLHKGMRVYQVAEDGEWRQVVSERISGWVHQKFLMKTTSS